MWWNYFIWKLLFLHHILPDYKEVQALLSGSFQVEFFAGPVPAAA